MGYSYAQRINVIEQKREKLLQQLDSLQRKEKIISAREREIERKVQARNKYRLGGLVVLAQAKVGSELSDEILLGALLQICNEKETEILKSWERYGAGLLKKQRHSVKESAAAQGFTQDNVLTETHLQPAQTIS